MKKPFFICSLIFSSFSALAWMHPLPHFSSLRQFSIPVSYTNNNKAVVLYIPSSCSGMINDAVAGEGEMAVSVLGKIQNGQLSVQVKVAYKGKATTTVEGTIYHANSNMAVSETKIMGSEPVDVFIKGSFKLKGMGSCLFISDIGYITVYPDGSVTDHILDPKINPDYSCPKVYCTEPKE